LRDDGEVYWYPTGKPMPAADGLIPEKSEGARNLTQLRREIEELASDNRGFSPLGAGPDGRGACVLITKQVFRRALDHAFLAGYGYLEFTYRLYEVADESAIRMEICGVEGCRDQDTQDAPIEQTLRVRVSGFCELNLPLWVVDELLPVGTVAHVHEFESRFHK
jgi:hypothetical protein